MLEKRFDWLGDAPIEYKFYGDTVSVFYDDAEHSYVRCEPNGERVLIPGVTTVVHVIDKSAALTQWAANMACSYLREEVEMASVMGNGWADMNDVVFEKWLGNAKYAHKTYKEKAGETGHIAHAWIEDYIKAAIKGQTERMARLVDDMPEDIRARNGCIAALDWMQRHKVRWLYTERKIYSKQHDFAGTMDGLAYVTSCGDAKCCGEVVDLVRIPATFDDVLAVIDWKTSNALYPEYDYQTAAYVKAFNEESGLGVEYRFIARLGKEDAEFESRFLPPERLQDDVSIFLSCLALYSALERRKEADKAAHAALKAADKAAKEAAKEAAKARKAEYKDRVKAAKADAKDFYKTLRATGMPVEEATAQSARHLADGLAFLSEMYSDLAKTDDEETLELAA